MARNAEVLARNIPQRNIDTRHRRRANDPGAVPKVLPEHHLPEMLDPPRVLSHQESRQVLNRADYRSRVPFECRLAPTDETGLIGLDLDKNPVAHPGVANEGLDRGDLHLLFVPKR